MIKSKVFMPITYFCPGSSTVHMCQERGESPCERESKPWVRSWPPPSLTNHLPPHTHHIWERERENRSFVSSSGGSNTHNSYFWARVTLDWITSFLSPAAADSLWPPGSLGNFGRAVTHAYPLQLLRLWMRILRSPQKPCTRKYTTTDSIFVPNKSLKRPRNRMELSPCEKKTSSTKTV